MNLTAEEKLMYAVMKAIYDSGIPVNFKGSMVLKACLMEAGYADETRHTVDIDANWYSATPPTGPQMVESLEKAIQKSGLDLEVGLYWMYGEGRSAGFELIDKDTDEVLFTMDMDVNRPVPPTRIYEVDGVRFCGVSLPNDCGQAIRNLDGQGVPQDQRCCRSILHFKGISI